MGIGQIGAVNTIHLFLWQILRLFYLDMKIIPYGGVHNFNVDVQLIWQFKPQYILLLIFKSCDIISE